MNHLKKYFHKLFLLNKPYLFYPLKKFQEKSSPGLACAIENFKNLVRGRNHRYGYDVTSSLYFVEEENVKHYFANRDRGFIDLYCFGINVRAAALAKSYFIDHIDFDLHDLVIDCGANYADLLPYLRSKIDERNYITFEPSKDEFRVIQKNATFSKNFNLGLGEDNKSHKFFINSKDADSSFIEPSTYSSTSEVQTITLNTFFSNENIGSVKLLKIEAEGFEPEILNGASDVIGRCEYVAIDGGYERGKFHEETFTMQSNFLYKNNFSMMKINFQWGRALFKNNANIFTKCDK